ncbi:MerR family transcriptional regulator [Tannockella kyphosi]|uniref:MerR family transcriptional regulator n=1 Tax=Tannockella kyphosi TaxID=2899121 RepID=UPI002013B65A|nr:MerR family transcriptional regulator [Tannockella kyphosi]
MKYSIGKMAKLNNVSQQTLRLYDKIGLFKPMYVKEENNYRMYDLSQCARLDLIQYLKNLGMTLKEIKEVFDCKDIELLQGKLEEEKQRIELLQQQLQSQTKAITRTIDSLEMLKVVPKVGQITVEFIPKRKLLVIDEKVNIYDFGLDTYESILRQFKEDIAKLGIDPSFYFNPGSIMDKEYFLTKEFYSTKLFVLVDEKIHPNVEMLPANMYACIYCDSFENEVVYASLLLEQIEKQGYEIVGDYLCETINDMILFDDYKRNMYLRLQIPIKL